MVAALPMQQQLDLIVLDARHDLAQHNADDALARDGSGSWVMPSLLQIRTHLQQTPAFLGAQGRRSLPDQRLKLVLQRAYAREAGIPPPLEFCSDKTIVRIDRVILAARPGRLVSRLLECQLDLTLLVASLLLMFCDCTHSCFGADRLQHSDDLGSYCLINS